MLSKIKDYLDAFALVVVIGLILTLGFIRDQKDKRNK